MLHERGHRVRAEPDVLSMPTVELLKKKCFRRPNTCVAQRQKRSLRFAKRNQISNNVLRSTNGIDNSSGGGRECQVAFRAHAGELHIELRCDGGGEWSASRPLP